jgi:tetratricopeptide (TPR) repeat protein
VKPVELALVETSKDGAPVRVLGEDMQVNLGADADEIYDHRRVQIVTQEGLAAANLQLAWNPETDVLYVHQIRILRGKETIDVLGSGQTFTVLRRETNLERAMLDGTLTAMLQPEGLQLGDVLELAYTLKRHDPSMQGRSELINFLMPSLKVERLHLRYAWPASKPVRWRKTSDMPEPKVVKSSQGTEIIFDLQDAKAPKPPELAPARYSVLGQVQVSQFSDWAEVASVMAPLYAKAATLAPKSALKTEAEKIAAQSSDPKVRASAALQLVQDRIRYQFLGMNFGAYTPADADVTWGRRFGDCKGKTVVLLALLKELGIEAEPAFVNTAAGDGMDGRLPAMELFNHVLVRARIDGKTYWLDGTRVGDGAIDQLQVPAFHWALPVQASGATLEKLEVATLDRPNMERSIRLDARAGLGAPALAHVEEVVRGDGAVVLKRAMANLSQEDADKGLKKAFESDFGWIEVKSTGFSFDPATREAKIFMDGAASMSWAPQAKGAPLRYETDYTEMGSTAEFKRETPGYTDLPYVTDFPNYLKTTEVILLPRDGEGFSLVGADVKKTVAGVEYRRTARLEKGVVTIEAGTRAILPEVPASEIEADKTALRTMHGDPLLVQGPAYWHDNEAEIAARTARTPTTAIEYANRSDAWLIRGDYAKAMADAAKAIELKPDDGEFVNDRCYARAEAGRELELAMADCEAALKISPKNAGFLDSRGLVWFRMGKLDEALKDYDTALALAPELPSSLFMRGIVKARLGRAAEGQADIKAALALNPYVAEDYARFGVKP